ncbi:MAG: simple sugar transport system permease protein [bacterium]|nr:MAG: simple sugar transport system permease protein [bacterium]
MNDALVLLVTLAASSLRLATPLVFAAMGGLLCERAGVVNIALEGLILAGAFAAAVAAHATGSPWLGLAAGILAGSLVGLIHALATVRWRADAIVSGTAINILVVGLSAVLARAFYGVSGSTPTLPRSARFAEIEWPLLGNLPVVGPVLFHHIPLVYLAPLLALVVSIFLSRTRAGLRLISVGEAPDAARSAGLSVIRIRIMAVVAGSAVAAVGGVFLAIGHGSAFARNMSAGRGFIALAALILGQWKPIPVLLTALFFGTADALGIILQGVTIPGLGILPVQFVTMIPYVLTLLLLAGVTGRSRPPHALGRPWPGEHS